MGMAMAVHYLPNVLDKKEHEALQRAVKDYPPEPYDKWKDRQSQRIAEVHAKHDEVQLVEVTAVEFIDYCKRTGARCDISTFTGFLWDKGMRRKARATANVPAH